MRVQALARAEPPGRFRFGGVRIFFRGASRPAAGKFSRRFHGTYPALTSAGIHHLSYPALIFAIDQGEKPKLFSHTYPAFDFATDKCHFHISYPALAAPDRKGENEHRVAIVKELIFATG